KAFILWLDLLSSMLINVLQNIHRSFKASQTEPLDESRQLNEVKRHSQGTFTSDYSKYLDTRRAQDFVQWLMSTKRSG
uniref:Glucagon / GIP / secretin / VIP family domain-containing protein n=1 Tax=Gopherus agassizii TaxID=38772 RepID=A0A452GNQ4_9SAUR